MVTAELATIVPFAVALAFLLLWIVSLGLTQIQITDASREAARMIARGESQHDATRAARRQAPAGATVSVSSAKGLVTVKVTVRSRLPVPYFSGVGSRQLESESVSALETP